MRKTEIKMTDEQQNEYMNKLGARMNQACTNLIKDTLPSAITVNDFQVINFTAISFVVCNLIIWINDISSMSSPNLFDNTDSLNKMIECLKDIMPQVEKMKNEELTKQ